LIQFVDGLTAYYQIRGEARHRSVSLLHNPIVLTRKLLVKTLNMLFRRRNLVAGAVIGASVANSRAASRQQEQMYQQQTQQQIAQAQADAASAQRDAQELRLQQQQQQQQQQPQQPQQPQPIYVQAQQPQPIYVQAQQPQPIYIGSMPSEPVPVPQQIVYQMPPAYAEKQEAHSKTVLAPPPPAIHPQQLPPPPAIQPQQPLLELFAPHIVDEESPSIKPHNIISVPQGARVRLVDGSLTEGLAIPYGDYILVNYNGKIGKISRLVVRKVEDD
jgi:hypothetical protein